MKIIAVTDRKNSLRPFEEQMEMISSAGVDMIVLREKDLSPGEYLRLAEKVLRVCEKYGTEFCVNTFADAAEKLGAKTVWIPYGDFDREKLRRFRTGVSVHSYEEGISAAEKGADFIVYGNVFETSCKPGKPAKGLSELKILSGLDIPVYAIGGIDLSNAGSVKEAGAGGICMMSGFMRSPDPRSLAESLRKIRWYNIRYIGYMIQY